jgi:hypothetical protein
MISRCSDLDASLYAVAGLAEVRVDSLVGSPNPPEITIRGTKAVSGGA